MLYKRIISMLLALVLLVGTIPPVTVSAEAVEETIAETVSETTEGATVPEETAAAAETTAEPETVAETALPEEEAAASVNETIPGEYADEVAGAVIRTGTLEGGFPWTMTDDGTLTISGSGVVTVESGDWPLITENGFSGDGVVTLILEEGITGIGNSSFSDISTLTTVTMPAGLVSVEGGVFANCSALKTLHQVDGLTSIGSFAFQNCSSLSEILLGEGLTEMGYGALSGTAIKHITFPGTMQTVGGFSGSTSLESVTINAGVQEISARAFYGCTNLKTVFIEYGLTTIGDSAFGQCRNLETVNIPDSVTTFGEKVFEYCSDALKTVVLPDSMPVIPKGMFFRCESLTSVVLPKDLETISDEAFSGCWSLGSIKLPDTLKTIGEKAFLNCTLETVTIPKNVESIAWGAFTTAYSNYPKAFYVAAGNTEYSAVDGLLYCTNGQILHTFPHGKDNGSFVVPKGVLVIGTKSFESCDLERLVLQEGVKSIGDYALNGFVRTVVIPKSVTTIGENAFSGNTTDIYYAGSAKDWGKIGIAEWNPNLENATIHYGGVMDFGNFGDGFKWEYAASGTLIISGKGRMPDFAEQIDMPWINPRTEITNIIIRSGITYIGKNAFNGCVKLESVVLPNSLTGIGENAFLECKRLNKVVFQGTKEEYEDIFIQKGNEALEGADISFQYLMDYVDNSAIKINGAGSAYAYYLGEANQEIRYAMNNMEYLVNSDAHGIVRIPLGTFEKKGTYSTEIQILQVGDLELEVPQVLTPKVTVMAFSFTQNWEVSYEVGVEGEVGPGVEAATASAKLFSVGLSDTVGVAASASRVHENGKDTLSLATKVKSELGGSVESGITSESNNSMYSAQFGAEAEGKIGGAVSYGIEIDNYKKDSLAQHMAIGAFFLEQYMLLNPGALMFREFYGDLRGYVYKGNGITATDGSEMTAALEAGMTLGSIEINDKELFDFGTMKTSGAIEFTEDRNSNGTSTSSASYKSEANGSILQYGGDVPIKDEGLGVTMMTEDVTVTREKTGNTESLEILAIEEGAAELRVFFLNKTLQSNWNKYTFSGATLQELTRNSPAIRGFVNGTNYVIGPVDIRDIGAGVSHAYAPVPFEKESHSELLLSAPLSIPFELGIARCSLDFNISTMESTEVTTKTGYAAKDKLRIATESNRSGPTSSEKWEFTDIIKNGFDALKNAAKEFFKAVSAKVGEVVDAGKAWIGGIGDSIHNWTVGVVTSAEDFLGMSYQVNVRHSEKAPAALHSGIRSGASSTSFSKAATIGSVVLVSVRDDDTGEYLDDFSVQPLDLTIRYAVQELEAAGLSTYSPVVQDGGIAMYRYSDEGDFYEYVGGVNDLEAMTVTAEIVKPGQYVLAVDSCAPSLESLDISDFRSTPTITAQVDDLSGLDMSGFEFALDGEKKVWDENVADHYDTKLGRFTYTVPEAEALAEGEHTMSFTLADTTGNSETYEYSFNVDLTAPVIGEVTVTGSTNAGSAVEVRVQVSDANLTDVYAVFSKRLPDGTWSDEVGTLMGDMGDGLWGLDYEGDGSPVKVRVMARDIGENTAESETFDAHPFVESITIPQDYLLLNVDDQIQLTAEVQPAELAEGITWAVEKGGENVLSFENGTVTAIGEGTAYIIASVSDGKVTLTDRCRIDVAAPVKLEGVQLGTTKLTTELYSANYAEFDILLKLPQNYAATAMTAEDKPEDLGIAITDAYFADAAMAELFDLVTMDDRTVAVVPTEKALTAGKAVQGKYTGTVTVIVQGKEYTSEPLNLTVKKTLPKLKASMDALNNFYSLHSAQIEISGATVTGISCENLPDWLTLKDGILSLTETVPAKGGSAKLTLQVETAEWAVPVDVALSVKCSYKVPGLKLSASSVQLSGYDSEGVKLQLQSKEKKKTFSDLGVSGISAPAGYRISGFNAEDGTFVLQTESGFQPGKISLEVSIRGASETVKMPLTVKLTPVTLKLSSGSITLNSGTGDSAVVTVTATPADCRVTAPKLRLEGSDKSDKLSSGELALQYEAGRLYVSTTDRTPDNAKYTLYISAAGGKETALKISTTNAEPTLKLKASGNLDLSFPNQKISLTTTFKNHSGGLSRKLIAAGESPIAYKVTETVGKNEPTEKTEAFILTKEGSNLYLSLREGASINVKSTYMLHLTLTLEDGSTLPASVKIPVKQTAVNLKLSSNKVTLNNTIADKATITVTCATKGYEFTEPYWELMDGKGKESAEGKLNVNWVNGKLVIAVNENTEPGTSYKLMVSAAKRAKATALTVTIPAANKSGITGTLKLTGNLDVVRDGTAVTVTPTFKNCGEADREDTITVLNGNGEDVTNLFTVKEEEGKHILTRAEKAKLDPSQKYTVVLTADFRNGITAEASAALKLKMGSAKLTLNAGSTTLFANDRNSRVSISFTSADGTLNKVVRAELDPKLQSQFELLDYGNGQYAIGFKDSVVPGKITSANISLNVWLEGNGSAKSNASLKVKLSIVR